MPTRYFKSRRRGAGGWRIFLLLGFVGCGDNPKFDFAEVSGKVTLNQKPLAGVMVTFYPISERREQLPYATGMTDAGGNFSLTHLDDKPGALVGPNRVVVYWPYQDTRGRGKDGKTLPPPGPPIPLQYTVASNTPLKVEVAPGGPQIINLPLKE